MIMCMSGDVFFCLMIRRPPRSTQSRSSAASDVYKRQIEGTELLARALQHEMDHLDGRLFVDRLRGIKRDPVSYTHLRAHETVLDLVCRLLLEKKKKNPHTKQL